jgi:hypothetical protein
MCAPRVTRHTSIRYSCSCHTRVNMGASIFFAAAMIRAFRSARSRDNGGTYVRVAQQSLMGQGLLITAASRLHSGTPLGRTPLDEWSVPRRDLYLTAQHSQETDIHATADSNPQSQQASGLRLRGHWHRPKKLILLKLYWYFRLISHFQGFFVIKVSYWTTNSFSSSLWSRNSRIVYGTISAAT